MLHLKLGISNINSTHFSLCNVIVSTQIIARQTTDLHNNSQKPIKQTHQVTYCYSMGAPRPSREKENVYHWVSPLCFLSSWSHQINMLSLIMLLVIFPWMTIDLPKTLTNEWFRVMLM
uniref:Uncharacterized protein n=1 Tax=Opuntia streptacantha TaxID=393608 RepID=A0A7C9D9U5_OPUST